MDIPKDFEPSNTEKLETTDKTSFISSVRISLLNVRYIIL